jgi:hypothetical protein
MTDERKTRYGDYVRELANAMGLRDWTISISVAPPSDENHIAANWATYGRKLQTLYLSERFLDSSAEEQRATLVHELVHAQFAHLHSLALRLLTSDGAKEAWTLAMEYTVDGIAEEWAKTLPLPFFADEKASAARKGAPQVRNRR